MFLWVMIIIGVLTAYWGYKKGLYVMFATLFNLMFAVFIAVLSTPKLLSLSAGYEDSGYYAAASVVLLFILVFGVLQFFAYIYFLRDAEELFPKLLDKAGGVILGFFSGYIVCSVLIFSFCVMPCSVKGDEKHFCDRDQLQTLSVPSIQKACNFLGLYSLHCFEGSSEKAIGHLLGLSGETPPEDNELLDNATLPPGISN